MDVSSRFDVTVFGVLVTGGGHAHDPAD